MTAKPSINILRNITPATKGSLVNELGLKGEWGQEECRDWEQILKTRTCQCLFSVSPSLLPSSALAIPSILPMSGIIHTAVWALPSGWNNLVLSSALVPLRFKAILSHLLLAVSWVLSTVPGT